MGDNLLEYLCHGDLYYLIHLYGRMSGKTHSVYTLRTRKDTPGWDYDHYQGLERAEFDPDLAALIPDQDEVPDLILMNGTSHQFDEDGQLETPESGPSIYALDMILGWGDLSWMGSPVAQAIEEHSPNAIPRKRRRLHLHRERKPAMVHVKDLMMFHHKGVVRNSNKILPCPITAGSLHAFWMDGVKYFRDGGPYHVEVNTIRIPVKSGVAQFQNQSTVYDKITAEWVTRLGDTIPMDKAARLFAQNQIEYNELAKDKFFISDQERMIFMDSLNHDTGI